MEKRKKRSKEEIEKLYGDNPENYRKKLMVSENEPQTKEERNLWIANLKKKKEKKNLEE